MSKTTQSQGDRSYRPIREVNRREFLSATSAAAGLALSAPFIAPRPARAADSIVVVDDGGSVQEAKRQIFFKKFTEDTGIEIIEANNNSGDLSKLLAMVMTGRVEWDAVYLNGQGAHGAVNEGLVEEIDYSVVNVEKSLHPEWVLPGALCYAYFSGGLAYNPATHPMGTHPRTYPEFWDVERFPGRRGMLQRPLYALEMALAADGVPPNEIYPVDYDRAFASLDRIKDHINVWMTQNEQSINMIQTGEVAFDFTFQNRVLAAQKAGISVEFVLDSTISGPSYIVIPKGSAKKELAMEFLTYVNRPDLQAALTNAIGMIPEHADAYPMVDPDMLAKLPNPGNPNAISLDMGWWGKNLIEADRRFNEWLVT